MVKSVWAEVIKRHTREVEEITDEVEAVKKSSKQDQEKIREVGKKRGKDGWMEVLVRYGGSEIYLDRRYYSRYDCLCFYTCFKAQRVRIDSDDFLILYHHNESYDIESISYVLWQDIVSIKFCWGE